MISRLQFSIRHKLTLSRRIHSAEDVSRARRSLIHTTQSHQRACQNASSEMGTTEPCNEDPSWRRTLSSSLRLQTRQPRSLLHQTRGQQRNYHAGAILLEKLSELSGKDKKKALKAKAEEAENGGASETQNKESPASEPPKSGTEDATAETTSQTADKGSSDGTGGDGQSTGDTPTETTTRVYSTPELTADAKKQKEGLKDPDVPKWQNPLHHNNPDYQKIFREDFDSEEEFQAAIVKLPPVARPDGSVPVPKHIEDLCDELLQLNMLEMNELALRMEEHFGFSEADVGSEGEGGGDDGEDKEEGEAKVEEKTAFDIKLTGFDAKSKIKIIKEVRALAGLGLKEAKEKVESVPVIIQKDVKKENAEEVKAKLEELGAQVEIV